MKKAIAWTVLLLWASVGTALAQAAVKGEMQESGIYQAGGMVGAVMEKAPGRLISAIPSAPAGKDVTFGFVFTFSGLGQVGDTPVKFSLLGPPNARGVIGYSAEFKRPVKNGKLAGWAGMRLWEPSTFDPNKPSAGEYTITVEVMGQTLSKKFTFK